MIFRGELIADEPMREAALSERFEVSRRTVREALSILEHAGLVHHHRHKGSRVAKLDVSDIRDLYRVRRTLELAAAESAPHAPSHRHAALAAAYQQLSDATQIGNAESIVASDVEFHRAVVGLIGSDRVDGFYAAIALEMRFALTVLEARYRESKRRPKAALAEHRQIFEALRDGNVSVARRLIGEHIDVNEHLLTTSVENRTD